MPFPRFITCTREINQSPALFDSIPRSSTITSSLPSRMTIDLLSKSPRTKCSPTRDSNLRIFTMPVMTTAPDSIEVTRVIGTNTRRRRGTSTTKPKMRGGWLLVRRVATASLTLPTGSPFGSKTAVPANLARNTRLVDCVLMSQG